MPVRLVINPVVLDGRVRRPKVATLIDAGRPPINSEQDDGTTISVPRTFVHVSAISPGATWNLPPEQQNPRDFDCLSLVGGMNMDPLDADPTIRNLLGAGSDRSVAEIREWLTNTPNSLGWGAARRNAVLNLLDEYGASTAGLTAQTPLWQIVNRLAQVWSLGWDIRQARTMARNLT